MVVVVGDIRQLRNKQKFRYEGDKILCLQTEAPPLPGILLRRRQGDHH